MLGQIRLLSSLFFGASFAHAALLSSSVSQEQKGPTTLLPSDISRQLQATATVDEGPPTGSVNGGYVPPLHTKGAQILDQNNKSVYLRGVNVSAHQKIGTLAGLDKVSLSHYIETIKSLGFNHVRLTHSLDQIFSNLQQTRMRPEDEALAMQTLSADPAMQKVWKDAVAEGRDVN